MISLRVPVWIGGLAVVLAGCSSAISGAGPVDSAVPTGAAAATSGSAAAGSAAAGSAGASPVPTFRSVRSYKAVALPVRLRIPGVKIDTRLLRLGLAADGTIAAPDEWQVAGWYNKGPRPGQRGPAVIVGHIDSRSGPAVFFRLPQLRRGDLVYVDRADGTTKRFKVTTQREFPKNRFPADLVYSPTLKPSLLLITCGGEFDDSTGHYRDNIVVSAVPG